MAVEDGSRFDRELRGIYLEIRIKLLERQSCSLSEDNEDNEVIFRESRRASR